MFHYIMLKLFIRTLGALIARGGLKGIKRRMDPEAYGGAPLLGLNGTVIKIHGDYLDTRIRNTPEELAAYPEPFNRLLDRVFDEFGLVVAGWSADWDEALRSAMTRAPYRRFSTYWSSRGEPSAKAPQ